MSDNISICISVDIPVGLVGKTVNEETIDNIKRFSMGLDLKKLRSLINDYVCTATYPVTSSTKGNSARESDYSIGDEVVFIGNGCAVRDRISRVLVETEMGYQVYLEDAFRSMTELVEHLKKNVHG